MTEFERTSVPVFWTTRNYGITTLKNWENLNERYLSKGWEIERVDELHDNDRPVLMYILRKKK